MITIKTEFKDIIDIVVEENKVDFLISINDEDFIHLTKLEVYELITKLQELHNEMI